MKMKSTLSLIGGVLLGVMITTGPAYTESLPSAKATARVGNVSILDAKTLGWTTVMSSQIKTSMQKDLFSNVSLECGLMTKTKVRSKTGTSDTSTAEAAVKVRVLVDGKQAHPGEVIFCRRTQELTAVFGGILQECKDANADGTITQDECSFTDEELELILDTMNANAFNFILDNVGTGVHKIEVQARIDSTGSAMAGEFDAKASIGLGAVTIEEVRMIKGDPIAF